jgi:hypothetical protein
MTNKKKYIFKKTTKIYNKNTFNKNTDFYTVYGAILRKIRTLKVFCLLNLMLTL